MNKLALNVLKTEFMIISTSQRLNILDQTPKTIPYIISVDGCQIRRAKSVKFLGFIVDDTLTWDKHVDYISTKISKNIGIIKHVRTFLPQHSLLTLYGTLIEPYLRYCNTACLGEMQRHIEGKTTVFTESSSQGNCFPKV